MKVKICGIQTLQDAKHAIDAGADYLGFIFVKSSKRYIEQVVAKKIISEVKSEIPIVGVFRDNELEEVNSLCEDLGVDFVQLHGEECPEFCEKVNRPVIKSFGLPPKFVVNNIIQKMKRYDVQYYLLDRKKPGEGESLSLESSAKIAYSFPLFFAGGLTPENVGEVVRQVKPFAVDVISGVKTNSEFDFEKMKRFIENAKGVNI